MKTSGSRKAIYAFTAPSSQKNKDPKDGKNERNKCFPKDFMYLRALITNKYKANMGNFFKSLFSFSSSDNNSKEGEATAQAKNEEKNFDILKFDGMRAHQMGKLAYAIKCYTEALAIKSDAEILNLLASAYSAKGDMPKAEDAINRLIALDPSNMQNRLARVHMLFAQGKEADVVTDCDAIIEQDPENAAAYFMRGKAKRILGGKLNAVFIDKNVAYSAEQTHADDAGIEIPGDFGNMYTREIESFSDSILNDKPLVVPASDAVHVQRIMEKAYASGEELKILKI